MPEVFLILFGVGIGAGVGVGLTIWLIRSALPRLNW